MPIIPRSDWDFPPYHRWTFQHIREMTPTAQIWRGEGPLMPLRSQLVDMKAVTYQHAGEQSTFGAYLNDTFVDGFLVLHKGAVVSETYLNGMKPHGTHLAMSVTKTIVGLVAGILVHRGVLDVAAPVTRYLPELEATAYKGATLQHVLDMTTGVTFDESYLTPGSHMQKLDQACGWKPHTEPDWPRTMWELILTLTEQERPHGAAFAYRSIETDVLGFVIERATGLPLADVLSQELWMPMGAGEDAYITVDHGGTALADGGFCATLRDYGRLALLLLDNGARDGRQIVPAAWIAETRGASGEIYQGIYRNALPDGAYHNQIWIEDMTRRAYMARGIFGQFIYVDPTSDLAVVQLATWPEFISDARTLEFRAVIDAIRSHLTA
jgi:CubicO group peptidase (beta-lactamase class C family)